MQIEIIRTSGAIEQHDIPRNLVWNRLEALLGATCFDAVTLDVGRVMIVDDNGYETKTVDHGNGHIELVPISARKPVNQAATELYWLRCRPGTTHQIVGDVAIVNDEDFADYQTNERRSAE